MRERFKNYQSKYKKAQFASKSTGFGVTDEDIEAGITSVKEKLNSMCPYFHEMDDLFGDWADVNPLYHVDAQYTHYDNDDPKETPSSSPHIPEITSSVPIDPLLTSSDYIPPSGNTNDIVSGVFHNFLWILIKNTDCVS